MSVENIVNINESNLQQVLEQSMTTPVLFYFWSERSQHCLQLTPIDPDGYCNPRLRISGILDRCRFCTGKFFSPDRDELHH